jgi:hypothetical protein
MGMAKAKSRTRREERGDFMLARLACRRLLLDGICVAFFAATCCSSFADSEENHRKIVTECEKAMLKKLASKDEKTKGI